MVATGKSHTVPSHLPSKQDILVRGDLSCYEVDKIPGFHIGGRADHAR